MKSINLTLAFGESLLGLDEIGLSTIKVDSVRLGQILINLISNSIRFTSPSPIRDIRVTVEVCQEPGRRRRVRVLSDRTRAHLSFSDLPLIFACRHRFARIPLKMIRACLHLRSNGLCPLRGPPRRRSTSTVPSPTLDPDCPKRPSPSCSRSSDKQIGRHTPSLAGPALACTSAVGSVSSWTARSRSPLVKARGQPSGSTSRRASRSSAGTGSCLV